MPRSIEDRHFSRAAGAVAPATGEGLETGVRGVAVSGAGAIGLTTALPLQCAGLRVMIHAKDLAQAPDCRDESGRPAFARLQRGLAPDLLAKRLEFAQRTVVNATGYGVRALVSDDSIVPVCGRPTRLIPQDDVHCGVGDSYSYGYGIEAAEPDRAEAEHGGTTLASRYRSVA